MATVTLSDVDAFIATTEKAVLVRFTNGQETWIPRSVCDERRRPGQRRHRHRC